MSNDHAPNPLSDPSELQVRVERLERHEISAEMRRDALRRDILAIGSSVLAALGVVAVVLTAQERQWIGATSIAQESWVVTVALIGTVINTFFLLWLAFLQGDGKRRRRAARSGDIPAPHIVRDEKEYRSPAATTG